MEKTTVLHWLGSVNSNVMLWTNDYWFETWGLMFFLGALIAMSPLKLTHEHSFPQACAIWIRKILILLGLLLLISPLVMLYIYDMTMHQQLGDHVGTFLNWFKALAQQKWFLIPGLGLVGFLVRFIAYRYGSQIWSSFKRKIRNLQSREKLSDVRQEIKTNRAKDYDITKHYKDGAICIGIDDNNQPIRIPFPTFISTNMQVVGPTQYGKGIILGGVMDQSIRQGNACIYIDPKHDKFAPHILYASALRAGRPFYYVTLHDNGPGRWAPFAGGDKRDALARLQTIMGLEMSGDPGTDYYKSQERNSLESAFERTRRVDGLLNELADSQTNRLLAELKSWSYVHSLCPPKGKGFSIEKALKEGAVVYVQGSLDDQIVKAATKAFILEVIQEARRLDGQRPHHLTFAIDEIKFLVSRQVAEACATVVGFRVNMILAYQSLDDLLNPDDLTLNGRALQQSVNINSQIRAVYGGSDFRTAEWIAEISGTTYKEIAKFEKTEIQAGGAEVWEPGRMISAVEENLITTNKVLTLPPRVCAFVQPRFLATIAYTTPVKVTSKEPLNHYIAELHQKTVNQHERGGGATAQNSAPKPNSETTKKASGGKNHQKDKARGHEKRKGRAVDKPIQAKPTIVAKKVSRVKLSSSEALMAEQANHLLD